MFAIQHFRKLAGALDAERFAVAPQLAQAADRGGSVGAHGAHGAILSLDDALCIDPGWRLARETRLHYIRPAVPRWGAPVPRKEGRRFAGSVVKDPAYAVHTPDCRAVVLTVVYTHLR